MLKKIKTKHIDFNIFLLYNDKKLEKIFMLDIHIPSNVLENQNTMHASQFNEETFDNSQIFIKEIISVISLVMGVTKIYIEKNKTVVATKKTETLPEINTQKANDHTTNVVVKNDSAAHENLPQSQEKKKSDGIIITEQNTQQNKQEEDSKPVQEERQPTQEEQPPFIQPPVQQQNNHPEQHDHTTSIKTYDDVRRFFSINAPVTSNLSDQKFGDLIFLNRETFNIHTHQGDDIKNIFYNLLTTYNVEVDQNLEINEHDKQKLNFTLEQQLRYMNIDKNPAININKYTLDEQGLNIMLEQYLLYSERDPKIWKQHNEKMYMMLTSIFRGLYTDKNIYKQYIQNKRIEIFRGKTVAMRNMDIKLFFENNDKSLFSNCPIYSLQDVDLETGIELLLNTKRDLIAQKELQKTRGLSHETIERLAINLTIESIINLVRPKLKQAYDV